MKVLRALQKLATDEHPPLNDSHLDAGHAVSLPVLLLFLLLTTPSITAPGSRNRSLTVSASGRLAFPAVCTQNPDNHSESRKRAENTSNRPLLQRNLDGSVVNGLNDVVGGSAVFWRAE